MATRKDNVTYLPTPGRNGGGSDDGEPPMSDLTTRVEHLERDAGDIKLTLARMEGRFDSIDAKFEALNHRFDAINTKLDTFATKAEVYQTLNAQTWKIIGLMGVMTALFTAIVRFLPPAGS